MSHPERQPDPAATQDGGAPPHAVRSVEVGEELETARGWRYEVRVFWEGGRLTEHTADLSWADHDYWSGGSKAPSRVIEAVVHAAAITLGPTTDYGGLPERFNAASLRRLVAGFDERVRERL
ncbi:MAG: hypothetical protein ACI89L_001875 [Phycisphaerales bacterium]